MFGVLTPFLVYITKFCNDLEVFIGRLDFYFLFQIFTSNALYFFVVVHNLLTFNIFWNLRLKTVFFKVSAYSPAYYDPFMSLALLITIILLKAEYIW